MSQVKPSSQSPTVVIHPSNRLVRPIFTLAFVLFALVFFYNNNRETGRIDALHIIPALVLLFAIARNIKRKFTSMTVGNGKLRYETGLFSKNTRTMDLGRIQDVRVEQTALERVLGIGTVAVETAGETGRIEMANVENPQGVADFILESAHK